MPRGNQGIHRGGIPHPSGVGGAAPLHVEIKRHYLKTEPISGMAGGAGTGFRQGGCRCCRDRPDVKSQPRTRTDTHLSGHSLREKRREKRDCLGSRAQRHDAVSGCLLYGLLTPGPPEGTRNPAESTYKPTPFRGGYLTVLPGIGDAVADEHHATDALQRLALCRGRGPRACQQRQKCQSLER
jgi:hypothetical protein